MYMYKIGMLHIVAVGVLASCAHYGIADTSIRQSHPGKISMKNTGNIQTESQQLGIILTEYLQDHSRLPDIKSWKKSLKPYNARYGINLNLFQYKSDVAGKKISRFSKRSETVVFTSIYPGKNGYHILIFLDGRYAFDTKHTSGLKITG